MIRAAPELRCVLIGDTVDDCKELDRNGCYYIPENISTDPLHSRGGAELLVFTLPMYAIATWEKMRDPVTDAVAAA